MFGGSHYFASERFGNDLLSVNCFLTGVLDVFSLYNEKRKTRMFFSSRYKAIQGLSRSTQPLIKQ